MSERRQAIEKIRSELFGLCEQTEDTAAAVQSTIQSVNDFNRGRAYEAKGIRQTMGEVLRLMLEEDAPLPPHGAR